MSDAPVIAIDGPSGTGKGTLARSISTWLNWALLDSGALYRVLGLRARRVGVALDQSRELADLAAALPLAFVPADDGVRVLLDGSDVSEEIRTEQAGADASQVAAIAAVREALLSRQRDFRRPPGLVADGRDMGTVVFPHAELKIFLTASPKVRAERRYKQLKQKGIDVNLARLSADIAARDRRDQERAVAPLQPASDAIILDTTALDVVAVEESVKTLAQARGLA